MHGCERMSAGPLLQVSMDSSGKNQHKGEDRRAQTGALSSSFDGGSFKFFTHLSPSASSPGNRGNGGHLLSF